MKLHLIGIFHTLHKASFSHCAFTGKARRFPKMMQKYGWKVIEYSNEGSESTADKKVVMLTSKEYDKFYGSRKEASFFGDDATIGSAGHQAFEEKLIPALRENLEPGDIICHPFGHAHEKLLTIFPEHYHVETGIGYPTLMKNSFRIFESYAWMHYHQGKENRNGKNYEWVVPNYYDLDDWDPLFEPGKYFAFLGRITSIKGMDVMRAMADYLTSPIILHGQGDPSPWQHPNIIYKGPISGKKRSSFLRNAKALLAPTYFTEPFCGMAVEAMLCGTPVISVDYGAMTETIQDGMGFRCHTLQDWLEASDAIEDLDRKFIADTSRSRYSLEACGKKYDKIFRQINDLRKKGWYEVSYFNYAEIEKEESPFAMRLAEWISNKVNPSCVQDLGCGPGMYVKALMTCGQYAKGYDIDKRLNYDNQFLFQKSIFDLTEQSDFVMCLEVAEHISPESSEAFLDAVIGCLEPGGTLLWSAAQPGQGGIGHINCKPKSEWQDMLEERGLVHQEEIEKELIKDMKNGYHMGWFISNAIIYKKQ
jgi:glycosyltransferase involved in cell wall biosynthesis